MKQTDQSSFKLRSGQMITASVSPVRDSFEAVKNDSSDHAQESHCHQDLDEFCRRLDAAVVFTRFHSVATETVKHPRFGIFVLAS